MPCAPLLPSSPQAAPPRPDARRRHQPRPMALQRPHPSPSFFSASRPSTPRRTPPSPAQTNATATPAPISSLLLRKPPLHAQTHAAVASPDQCHRHTRRSATLRLRTPKMSLKSAARRLKLGCCSDLQPSPLRSAAVTEVRMTEAPFVPRERLIEKQKYFQRIHKHTYLKGPYDKITSVAIPAALAATSLFLIGRGIYNMSHVIGKKE